MEANYLDPVLGQLIFNEQLNWYEGWYHTGAHGLVRFAISLDAVPTGEAALREARALIPRLAAALDAARAFACEKLLPLKNGTWLADDEPPVSAAEFMARLTIDSISLYAGRKGEFFFRDGDLFWGHTVLLSWSEARGFHGADLAG